MKIVQLNLLYWVGAILLGISLLSFAGAYAAHRYVAHRISVISVGHDNVCIGSCREQP